MKSVVSGFTSARMARTRTGESESSVLNVIFDESGLLYFVMVIAPRSENLCTRRDPCQFGAMSVSSRGRCGLCSPGIGADRNKLGSKFAECGLASAAGRDG